MKSRTWFDRGKTRLKRFRAKRLKTARIPVVSRRRFWIQGALLIGGGFAMASQLLRTSASWVSRLGRQPIRPPSAGDDDSRFQAACIRCGLCGTVCENGCIRFYGMDETEHGALTPYLNVRERSCTLCMRCTQICPTGALSPIEDTKDVIASTVRMGTAVVDPDRCLSYLGRICGYCHDACPLPQLAIRLTPPAKPVVLTDGCVGCGRCVEMCPQTPTAIDVFRDRPFRSVA